jgi:MFS family permease
MVFSPILPLVEDEFVVGHAQASGIFVFLFAGYGVGVIITGLFSGTFGYKKSIISSLLPLSLISFSIPFIHKFWLLYVFSFYPRFFGGFLYPFGHSVDNRVLFRKELGQSAYYS